MISAIQWKKCQELSLNLARGELHLWRIDLSEIAERSKELLSPDELERFNRYRVPKEQQRFLSARSQLRQILARYTDCPADIIRFEYNDKGKPTIMSPETDIKFNLSHSADLALLVVSQGIEVGIDLEPIKMRMSYRRIAQRVFDRETVEQLNELDEEAFPKAFLYYWTLLEARVKATGAGVFDFPQDIKLISARSFIPADNWIAAVASINTLPDINEWLTLVSCNENDS